MDEGVPLTGNWRRRPTAPSVGSRYLHDFGGYAHAEVGSSTALTASVALTLAGGDRADFGDWWTHPGVSIDLKATSERLINNLFTNTLEELDPFGEIVATNLRDWRARLAIQAIRREKRIAYRDQLADRLEALLTATQEEDSAGPGISSDSIKHFVTFVRTYPRLKPPSVTIMPTGDLYAEWRSGPTNDFSAHFLPNGTARFVVFAPDPAGGLRPVRIWGISSVASLMRTVRPHGIQRWAMNEG